MEDQVRKVKKTQEHAIGGLFKTQPKLEILQKYFSYIIKTHYERDFFKMGSHRGAIADEVKK